MKIVYVYDSNGNLVTKDLVQNHAAIRQGVTESVQAIEPNNLSLVELKSASRELIVQNLERLLSDPIEKDETAKYQQAFLEAFDDTPIQDLWDTTNLAGVNFDENPPKPKLNLDLARACVRYKHNIQVLDLLYFLTIKEGVHLYNYQNGINTANKNKRARESFCKLFYQKHPTHGPEADELYKEILERAKYFVAANTQLEFEGFEVLFKLIPRRGYSEQNLKTPNECNSEVLDQAFAGIANWVKECVQEGRINKEHFLKSSAWSRIGSKVAIGAAVETICVEEEKNAGRINVVQGIDRSLTFHQNCSDDELFPFLSERKYTD